MKRWSWIAAVLALGVVVGCGSDEPTTAESPSEVEVAASEAADAAERIEATTTPEPPPEQDEAQADLPARADMESWEVILAEGIFIDTVRNDPPEDLGGIDDAALITAGNTACNAMDNGAELRQVLISIAAVMPELENTDTVAVIGGAAAGTLCPEHLDYLD